MFKKNASAIPLLCLLAALSSCVTNPFTGKRELNLFSVGDDVKIGNRYAPEVQKQLGGAIANSDLQRYVNMVGQRIAARAKSSHFPFKYVAVNDSSLNAMALPGGHIFITRGLLEKLSTEAQLAGVLAHETVHVVARHSTHQMSNQVGINVLLSAAGAAGASDGALTVSYLATQLIGLSYSREQEKEADLGGIDYMMAARYDPSGMVEMMKILEANSRGGSIEFLSAHPSTGNRIEYLGEDIQSKKVSGKAIVNAEEYRRHVLSKL